MIYCDIFAEITLKFNLMQIQQNSRYEVCILRLLAKITSYVSGSTFIICPGLHEFSLRAWQYLVEAQAFCATRKCLSQSFSVIYSWSVRSMKAYKSYHW